MSFRDIIDSIEKALQNDATEVLAEAKRLRERRIQLASQAASLSNARPRESTELADASLQIEAKKNEVAASAGGPIAEPAADKNVALRAIGKMDGGGRVTTSHPSKVERREQPESSQSAVER